MSIRTTHSLRYLGVKRSRVQIPAARRKQGKLPNSKRSFDVAGVVTHIDDGSACRLLARVVGGTQLTVPRHLSDYRETALGDRWRAPRNGVMIQVAPTAVIGSLITDRDGSAQASDAY
jgi:hypothetical protein